MSFQLRLFCCFILALAHSGNAADIRFNRDIRPILSSNCFHCHGPDEKHRKAELRLDEQDGIQAAFSGGVAKSEAWQRIVSDDPDTQMPPADSHLELKPREVALIKAWVDAGAKWEGHWAFVSPTRPAVPNLEPGVRWANPIDRFILYRLEQEGLQQSPKTDRERLLRRVTFDLTGLPPTIAEIDAFLLDKRPDAYERVVERLLGSPHFGERMALGWMDAARYGDTSVFHADGPRTMWPWRDWVIKSYNDNKPFDRFTIEQLAGDLLPNADTSQKVATGFLRNNASTDEGGAIAEEFRVEYAVDRVKTTSMVWLGLSLECAQCHNHKYDPFTQEDYYRFFAYFNQASDPGMQTRRGNQSPVVQLFDPSRDAKVKQLSQQRKAIVAQRDARADATGDAFKEWLTQSAGKKAQLPKVVAHYLLDGDVSNAADAKKSGKVVGNVKWDKGQFGKAAQVNRRNYVVLGDVGDFDTAQKFSYGCWLKTKKNAVGSPIARLNEGNAFRGYDVHCSNGNVEVHLIHNWPDNAIKVTTKKKLAKNKWQHLFITYDGSSKASGIRIYVDGKLQAVTVNEDRLKGTIRTKVPFHVGRRNSASQFVGAIDDVRIYDRQLTDAEVLSLAGRDPIGELLAIEATKRTEEQTKALQIHFLQTKDKEYKRLTKALSDVDKQLAAANKPTADVMIMSDVAKMRQTYVLNRGNYASPLKDRPVSPGVLSALPRAAKDSPQNRLGLAKWIVQKDHPLTARVTVNRYWYMFFGTGIVKTLEDFGAQGEWPSHPALLDWLAIEFVESGWNVKHMIKLMVMSETYRQSSRVTAELMKEDPENRLLARGPRFRLQGEFIRDNALAASGLLISRLGGAGTKPYQPGGLWNEVSLSGNVRFKQDHKDKLYRRSMYIYWKRSAPAPAMTIFDAPTREKCTLRRSRTNTPLQALVTLNDVQFVEAARLLARRVMQAHARPEDQIRTAYRLVTGASPSKATQTLLLNAFREERAVFSNDLERANQLLKSGEYPRADLDAASHAAMTVISSIILNLDESLTRG